MSRRTFAILTTQLAAGQESPPNSSSSTGSERTFRRVPHRLSTRLLLVDTGDASKCVCALVPVCKDCHIHRPELYTTKGKNVQYAQYSISACFSSQSKNINHLCFIDLLLKIFSADLISIRPSGCVFRGQMMFLKFVQRS